MELGKWKLSDLYVSNSAFTKDLAKAKNYVKNIEKYQNKLIKNDKKILLDYFKEDEEFSVIAEKLAVYARVKFDDNGSNMKRNASPRKPGQMMDTARAWLGL